MSTPQSHPPRNPGRDDDDRTPVDDRVGAAPDLLDIDDDPTLERSSDDLTGHGRSDAYDDEAAEKYLIGSIEERHDDYEVISPQSPLGRALVGATIGDIVTYETPTGATLSVEILDVGA